MLVNVICERNYQRFYGDSVKNDVRVFNCTETNCIEIAETMKTYGWEVSLEYTGKPVYPENED